jgi:hydroxypyruvate reductase
VPDTRSLAACAALLELLEGESDADVLLLISGGASSLVEALPAHLSLEELKRANAWLLASGLDIAQVNAVRRRLSLVKGGKLLAYLSGRRVRALLLSDVAGDDPAVIGSGLVAAPAGADPDVPGLPDWLADALVPPQRAVADVSVEIVILANNRSACQAFAQRVQVDHVPVFVHDEPLEGDARETGERIAEHLQQAPAGVHVWGGETTVRLPPDPGVGGRNQHLALAAARVLEGNSRITLLALGTDGSDGPTDDAGALIDGATLARGRLAGLDPTDCLARADAGRFLEASGDLVTTGPTGTNLNDLVVGWVT